MELCVFISKNTELMHNFEQSLKKMDKIRQMESKIFDEFFSRREAGNEKVFEQDFLPYKRFFNLDTNAYSNDTLESKYKELIGLACSLVLRCNDCVLYHLDNCVKLGLNRKEINEAMNIALVIGGSIVVPHLRFALIALDEILPNESVNYLDK